VRLCDSGPGCCGGTEHKRAAYIGTLYTSDWRGTDIVVPDVAYCEDCANHPNITDDYRDRQPIGGTPAERPWEPVSCRARCELSGGCDWDNPRVPCPQTWPLDEAGQDIPPEELL
jgi:hypothetical protein